MLIKLASSDSQLTHVYQYEYGVHHCIEKLFIIISSYHISQERITLLPPQFLLSCRQDLAF